MTPKEKTFLPELLAPAGDWDALCAAVEAGADAVYFGSSDYNARMRAENFDDGGLERAVGLCRRYGVKTYITLNTRLRETELRDAARRAVDLYAMGADAFIVADLALAKLLKEVLPDIELHASTQTSVHSSLDAKALYDIGFSRIVCPRETSFEEIKNLVRESPAEIEMFIHGAHCVSFSGQCMMSYAMGGRSGNRGECAQPCRLPFSAGNVKSAHSLSLKDMCLAGRIRDVISTKAASLKIEGRQKSADYVYGVTRIYRRLLDERRNADESEIKTLAELFCRGGFTDGYFSGRYRSMLGIRSDADKENSRNSGHYEGLKRKIPLSARLTLRIGEPARLEVSAAGKSTAVLGDTVTEDTERPISSDAARRNAARLGGTEFILDKFEFNADSGAFYTLSGINALRRKAVEKLSDDDFASLEGRRKSSGKAKELLGAAMRSGKATVAKPQKILRTAEFTSLSQVSGDALSFFDRIYIPISEISHADGDRICVALEPLTFDRNADEVRKMLAGYSGEVLVHGLGQARLVSECRATPAASYRFNVFSASSAEAVSKYAAFPMLSPEMPLRAAKDVAVPFSLIVYGKIPLMHTMRCMISDGGSLCPFAGNGGRSGRNASKKEGALGALLCDGRLCRSVIKDRRGASFPVIGLADCTNIIYNSVPIYMADAAEKLVFPFAARHHFIFSDESAEECSKIIDNYTNARVPDKSRGIKRLK